MKNYLSIMTLFVLLLTSFIHVQAETVDYEKYGKIAIAVVKADYPGEPVTDYQYIGREKSSETEVQDSFKFQVKENGKPLNVLVKVRHSIQNNKLLNLTVEEMK
jgi:uncharacterized phage infection (PIP) family protein YhgE